MKPIATYIVAAALAVGGASIIGCDSEDTSTTTTTTTGGDTRTAGDKMEDATANAGDKLGNAADKTGDALKGAANKTGDALNKAGDKLGDAVKGKGTAQAPDAEGIRDILALVAETSVMENGLNNLSGRFVDADRNRIGDIKASDQLNQQAAQFRKDWQAKYGEEFDIKGTEENYFPDNLFKVVQGEQGPNAGGVEVDVDRDADSATVDVDRKSGVDTPDTGAADANRNDPGRNIATVTVMASHGLPEVKVPLIHEAPDNWRIDVPDTMTAQQLQDAISKELTGISQAKAQWPADKMDAYRLVTHHMLMAVLGQQHDHDHGK